jgi:8-oxo-dGTP diphosphatase
MPAPYCYEYPRPMVTVDLVVFSLAQQSLRVLLVRRGREPFAGKWAIPGGFLEMDEPAEAGARRELREETGLEIAGTAEPIGFFARPDRDPRGRTIALAHAAVVPPGEHKAQGGDDAVEAVWFKIGTSVELAFDHAEILDHALAWLRRGVIEQAPRLALVLLHKSFGLEDVHALFKGLGLPRRQVLSWLRKVVRSGQIERVEGPSPRFHWAGSIGGITSRGSAAENDLSD